MSGDRQRQPSATSAAEGEPRPPGALAAAGQPLVGVTVLDLTRLLPGPFCSWLLRSWGARVIKVEDLGPGDYLRQFQPLWFQHLNAGAESIALDLKRPQGREILLRLLPQVDLVMESFRPGVMERMGLGYGALAERNPQVVLLSLSGYDSDGPDADRAGHDLGYLARSGLLSLMDGAPSLQLADLTGALTAAASGLAALVGARASGRGSHVELSLHGSVRALGGLQAVEGAHGAARPREEMPLGGFQPWYRLYPTADGGQVALAALEPKFWDRFCEAAGRDDWRSRQGDPTLGEELAALFRTRTTQEWQAWADHHPDACLDPVLSIAQALSGLAQLQPTRFDGFRPQVQGPAPAQGEQTQAILRQLGLSEQEIAALVGEVGCKG